jgi:hypothetical protein
VVVGVKSYPNQFANRDFTLGYVEKRFTLRFTKKEKVSFKEGKRQCFAGLL